MVETWALIFTWVWAISILLTAWEVVKGLPDLFRPVGDGRGLEVLLMVFTGTLAWLLLAPLLLVMLLATSWEESTTFPRLPRSRRRTREGWD